jgi:cyclase
MRIIPAIDIIGGECVRLTKGIYDSKKIYSKDPIFQAKKFAETGASIIHLVDLDGAKAGKPINQKLVLNIKKNVNVPVQIGGGIRNLENAKFYLDNGIDRIIIGTKAIQDLDFVKSLLEKYGSEKIVIGVDIKNNQVATSGWLETSTVYYLDFIKTLKRIGIKELVVTDINKDGTLTEPNYELIKEISDLGFNVIASGGVSSLEALKKLQKEKTWGAIIGKALYENKITLKESLQITTKNFLTKRIIPCLDIKNDRVVKGINFKNLSDTGDPIELGKYYAESGADELVFLDITATNEKRETVKKLVEKISKEIFIPFTVGGGVSTTDDIRELLNSGADKVAINSMAVKNPNIITESAKYFGSQCIVVAIDTKRVGDKNKVFIKGGREETTLETEEWAKKVENLGGGEILLTSMDNDGTKKGYDTDLLKKITNLVNIPVIASGGAGKKEDLFDAFFKGSADAVLAASIFHNKILKISDVKKYLKNCNLSIRI